MTKVERGDLVTVAIAGDYGKPRPALVVQADAFAALPSVTLLLLSSEIVAAHLARITIDPTEGNGMRVRSQIMIDKAMTVPRGRIGGLVGRIDTGTMRDVGRALVAFLALEDETAAKLSLTN